MKRIKYQIMTEINLGTEDDPDIRQEILGKSIPYTEANYQLALQEAYQGEVSVEDAGPDPNAKKLEEKKEELISISNKELDIYLKEHPITWVDGQQYSVTKEKQGLLTSNIALYQLSVQAGKPRELKWNTTGDVCTVWTIENLSALALAIGDYVQPYVTYQQTVEVQIKECTTMEELEAIVIDYSTVSTVKPEVLTGEQGS